MFKGRNKAVTFSFDDGITQDIKIIEILDRYGLKATFNLNSELLGLNGEVERNNKIIPHNKLLPEQVKQIYFNHEIGAHTLTHPNLMLLSENDIIYQVEQDRMNLSELCGYEVVGLAYPGGYNDDRIAKILKENTGVKYARTITSTYNFDLQDNLLRFNPSIHSKDIEKLFDLGKQFLQISDDTPALLYIWGHGFDFDAYDSWGKFEEFCKMISGYDNIYYGTNREVLV